MYQDYASCPRSILYFVCFAHSSQQNSDYIPKK
jgi:hypothetical protein